MHVACAATEGNLYGLRAEQLLIENQKARQFSRRRGSGFRYDPIAPTRITMNPTRPPGERSIHEPLWQTKKLHADQS